MKAYLDDGLRSTPPAAYRTPKCSMSSHSRRNLPRRRTAPLLTDFDGFAV